MWFSVLTEHRSEIQVNLLMKNLELVAYRAVKLHQRFSEKWIAHFKFINEDIP